MTSFEPEPTRVVIDRKSVAKRPIRASAWSRIEGREYDDLTENHQINNDSPENDSPSSKDEDRQRKRCSESWRSKAGNARK